MIFYLDSASLWSSQTSPWKTPQWPPRLLQLCLLPQPWGSKSPEIQSSTMFKSPQTWGPTTWVWIFITNCTKFCIILAKSSSLCVMECLHVNLDNDSFHIDLRCKWVNAYKALTSMEPMQGTLQVLAIITVLKFSLSITSSPTVTPWS